MKRLVGGGVFLLILLAALYVPVTVPFDATSIGKVLPAREWKLLQDQTGHISSVIRDYRTGMVEQMGGYQFESGDVSGMEISVVRTDSGGYVTVGDTVVRMYSAIQKQQLLELSTQIDLFDSQLKAEQVGEKNPIVQEAENKLYFAQQDLTLKKKNYDINKSLYDDAIIAKTVFLAFENEYELARIQVEIAQKNLETVRTGLKNESLNVTQNRIDGLRQRAALLRQKGLKYLIRAPFTGYVSPILMPGELLTVQSADAYILQIPVKVQNLPYLSPQTVIDVTDAKTNKTYQAKVLQVAPQVEVYDSRQVAVVVAALNLPAGAERLGTGVSANSVIHFGAVDQREYLRRLLNFTVQKK
jgi:hypothetical protein